MGTFVAGGSYEVGGDRPLTLRGGGQPKVVESVGQVSFSGPLAVAQGKPVLYVTERAVFRLTSEGLELTEIAPGLDLDADVLAHMSFTPRIGEDLREMDPRLFRTEPMGLTLQRSHGEAPA